MLANRARGFTIIEMMIAVSIVALLVALALPNFSAWMQNVQVRNSAESILNGLQVARATAVKRNTPVEFVLPSLPASDWQVLPAQSPPADPVKDIIQQRSSAEGGKSASVTADSKSIAFNGMGWPMTANPDPTNGADPPATQIDVKTNGTPDPSIRALRILINPAGSIRMCDPSDVNDGTGNKAPALPSGDPRRCDS